MWDVVDDARKICHIAVTMLESSGIGQIHGIAYGLEVLGAEFVKKANFLTQLRYTMIIPKLNKLEAGPLV